MTYSRRDFLTRAAAPLAGLLAGSLAGPWIRAARALSLSGSSRKTTRLEARAYFSMHTVVEVVAAGERPEKLILACEAAHAACRAVDARMNFHGPGSELSRLNREGSAGGPSTRRWTEVSPALFQVLSAARRVWEESEGAFDPTVGASVLLFREARRRGRWPSREKIEAARRGVGMGFVDLDPAGRRVRLGKPALLDLSGIAKGYAADRAARAMREAGAAAGIVNAGGDLFVFGSAAALPPVTIEDPFAPGRMAHALQILEEGLATSGDSEQGVIVQGRPCSHLIDPSHGRPVQGTLGSASARAASGMLADAWASALYVRPGLAEASQASVESLLLVAPGVERAGPGFFRPGASPPGSSPAHSSAPNASVLDSSLAAPIGYNLPP